MSWKAKLIRPIEPAEGDIIVTLSDARQYLLRLPKDRHNDPIVQATIQALLMAAKGNGPILHAQAGMAQVISGKHGHQYNPEEKRTPAKRWRRR